MLIHRFISYKYFPCWRLARSVMFIFMMLYMASFCAVLMTREVITKQLSTQTSVTETKPEGETTTFVNISITSSDPEPVIVILLTYQRSGSSFLGQIFNRNPEAFYAFEPLDGLYSAIYGTSQGYNTPSDIVQYWDGRQRIIPDFEVRSSAAVLKSLLTCEHDSLPTEIITNIFWVGFRSEHLTANDYIECLVEHKISYNNCKAKIRICKTWLGQKGSKQDQCRQQLWTDTSPNPSPTLRQFQAYKKCMNNFHRLASPCFPKLKRACNGAVIRSAKVVRLSMRAIEVLLKNHPSRLKVVHLLRDPKAVVVSRMKYESVRGHFAGQNKTAEAMTLCRVIHDDLVIRHRLEQEYPDVFHQVIYEEFIKDPVGVTRDIYRHIGQRLPKSVEQFMASETARNNTGPLHGITDGEARAVDAVCGRVYQEMRYAW